MEVKMHCNCKWTDTVLGLVILVVTLWPNLLGSSASWWVTVVAAVLVVAHAWSHAHCEHDMMEMPKARRRR